MVRAVQGEAQLHERGSNADWFWVDYLIYYEHRRIRAFVYVRRKDGTEIPDDDYDVVDELGERRRRWRKRNGNWQARRRQGLSN